MKNRTHIEAMLRHIDKVLRYCDGLTYDEFTADELKCDGCILNVSQIGEHAGKIDAEFRAAHTQIPWRDMCNVRNRIVLDYEGIRFDIVWAIITEDLPALRGELAEILKEFT